MNGRSDQDNEEATGISKVGDYSDGSYGYKDNCSVYDAQFRSVNQRKGRGRQGGRLKE
ncbi:hypothetical protein LOAG_04363 [Loa loa]|uniref:Uncharacterized protein n=1 Tax=Loa loa TaxID=7209 RepID=A0A1S0U2A9_LOALO|nr:hypothetical protein LOAG_04363 [Loa loa]EFO24124.1 hypothetical protein LOAG_04363 [Loa loa]